MDVGELIQYGLYGLTVVLGVALLAWIVYSRRADERELALSERAPRPPARAERDPSPQVDPLRAPAGSLADALAGFDFPTGWQPDPPAEVRSPLTLSTMVHSEGEVAALLSDELVRLGYRVTPTGARTARATRDSTCISIEVEPAGPDSVVTSRLTLTDSGRG
ncbi:MAG: hypothetical protein HKN24_03780 [Acidimicrobiales bacterium]|nr:hypothetical protein [Acidimicrobiales bacterium]